MPGCSGVRYSANTTNPRTIMAEVDNKTVAEETAPKEEVAAEAVASNGDAPAEKSGEAGEKGAQGGEGSEEQEKPKWETDEVAVKAKIVKQVEYYFGDLNLTKDRFLKEQVELEDGWITSDRMLKFNRLRNICSDWGVIVKAIRESSELVEVNEDGTKIRRSPSKPLPTDSKERRDDFTARTVYTNRFPYDSRLDDLMPFFESYGPVENVFMKRDFHKRTFKGSVFVTFTSKEDAEKFLNEEGTKYKTTVLEVKQWKTEYFKGKTKREPKKNTQRVSESKSESREQEDSKRGKPDEKEVDADDEEQVKQQMSKKSVLHISGMSQETNREEVRALFLNHGDVSWVDFDKGVTEGYVRLKEPGSATATLESLNKIEGGVKLHGTSVHVRIVEGDEELQYWQKMYRDIADRKQAKRDGRLKHRAGQQNRRGRGGYQGRRGGKRNNFNDGPPAKVSRVEFN